MRLTRLQGWALGGLLLVVALLARWAWSSSQAEAHGDRGPVVIGLIQALSGPSARQEAPLVAATQLAVDDINEGGGLLGRRVELRVEDSRGDPRLAAAAAERLITEGRVVALFGCGSSACREAVQPVVESHRHLLFYPLPHEGMGQSAHIVYTGPTPNQQALPAADWAMRRFGRRVFLVGTEGVHARRVGAVLKDFISLVGGQVLGERQLPAGSGDMGEVLAELQKRQPDVVLSLLAGESNRAFFDGLVAAGLANLPLMSLAAAEPELKADGGGRLDRHFTAWAYLASLPGEVNEDFLKRLRRHQGETAEASDPAVSAYVALQLWAAAVREVRSPQTQAVNANVPHQTVMAPQGFAALDARSRHLWRQLRIAQVKPDGTLAEVLLLPRYIRPEPWPVFRSAQHWAAQLAQTEAGP